MTRFVFLAILAAIILAILFGLFHIKDSYKLLPVQDSKLFIEPSYSHWHPFKSEDGTFSILTPAAMQRATQTVTDPKTGVKRYYDMYVAQQDNGTTYMISKIRFTTSAESKENIQKSVVTDLLQTNPLNQLRSMQIGQYKKYKTNLFTIVNPEHTIEGMTFMDGNNLFILSAMFLNDFYKPDEFQYFMKSFDLSEGN